MRIEVNTDYDDSVAGVAQVQDIVSALPSQAVPVQKGDTLSQVVLRQYGFGPGNLPDTYAVLSKQIMDQNGLETERDLKPGTITIPTLPRRALQNADGWSAPLENVPKVVTLETAPLEDSTAEGIESTFVGRLKSLIESRRTKSKRTQVRVKMPKTQLASFLSRIGHVKAVVEDTPMLTVLAGPAASGDAVHRVLTTSETQRIGQLLGNPARRNAMFVVLDTGWPTPEVQSDSINRMQRLLADASAKLRLPKSGPAAPTFADPVNRHCMQIDHALREFRQLDTRNVVGPIYVPMTRDQGAGPLLEELLFIHFVQMTMGSNAGLDVPPARDQKQARENAKAIVARLPSAVTTSSVQTDKALLDALFTLAALNDQTFIVNTSWTVPNQTLLVVFPNTSPGVVVTAVGNDKRDVHQTPVIDFPARCLAHLDTLAVMNSARGASQLLCDSSRVNMSDGVHAQLNAVTFDGDVEQGVCGTSFSAPRVGWLISLYEIARKADVPSSEWAALLHSRIVSVRSGQGFAGMWLDPARFLEGIER